MMKRQPSHAPDYHNVDVRVGARLRQRRLELGLSQQRLAEVTGNSFQLIAKYETAANRVSPSRLYRFAMFLNVPIAYFFEDLPHIAAPPDDPLRRAETVELVEAYYAIQNPKQRRAILNLVRGKGNMRDRRRKRD